MEQPNDNCTTNEQKEIEFIAVQREYHKIEPTINDRKENNSEADDASSELSTDICIYDTAYDLKQDPDNPLLFHICLKSSSHSLTSMSPCFNGPKIKSCFVPLRDFRIRHRRRSLNFLVPKPPPATSKEKKSVPVQKKNAKKKQPPAPMKQIQKAVLTKPPVPSHPIKDPLQDNDAFMTHEISERSENVKDPTSAGNVKITKDANLPRVNTLPLNQSIEHQPKKRKRSDSVIFVHKSDSTIQKKSKYQTDARSPSIDHGGKASKKFKHEFAAQQSKYTFEDIGGMKEVLQKLCELLMEIKQPEVYRHIGLLPPRGLLLHGPSGSGKTLLAHSIAGQLNVGLISVTAFELVAGIPDESEERIRNLFEQATALTPCVLFIEEIDAISSNRLNTPKGVDRRVLCQLLKCLDDLSQHDHGVLIIGATTNRPDALDPALRRVGRLDLDISLGIPNRNDRADILQVICRRLPIKLPIDYDQLGELTPGFVGADLLALGSRAASIAVKRAFTTKQRDETMTEITKLLIMQKVDGKNVVIVKYNGVDDDKEKGVMDQSRIDNDKNEEQSNSRDTAGPTTEAMTEEMVKSLNSNEKANIPNSFTQRDDQVVQANKDKGAVKAQDDDIIEMFDESNCNKRNSSIHSQISFDGMKSWLSDYKPILTPNDLDDLSITMSDFMEALKVVQPSAKWEGFITVPDVTWDDIGSLRQIRDELRLAVLAPVKFPNQLQTLGLKAPFVLLCGPPGCGKTLLAKAVANEAGINFISVKGPELLHMYVGESERAVRECFQRAKNATPCVIFFDEFDSLCQKKSDSGETYCSSRLVNQLLAEVDGIEDRKDIFLMAATNRPDMVDPALMRPGRFDKILYVGLPELNDRVEIFKALTKEKPILADDVDINELASSTDGYTGADLAGLVRQASLYALKEIISLTEATSQINVSKSNFIDALKNTKSSISEQDKLHYEKLRMIYAVTHD